jgi:hypothetical protein
MPFQRPGEKLRVSSHGGNRARWRSDGSEVFYVQPDRQIMAAAVLRSGRTIQLDRPRALFKLPAAPLLYEPSPDGQRFLVSKVVTEPSPITILLNWNPAIARQH